MRYQIFLATILSRVLASPGFVRFDLGVARVKKANPDDETARAYIPDEIQNGVLQYTAEIDLGTPGQTQKVLVDTGSSDLWVQGPNSHAQYTYDPSNSSTAKYINNGLNDHYADGTSAIGDYYNDTSSWGGFNVTFQFGVTNDTSSGTGLGIFGIGPGADYPNYPVALKQQGLIESTAFSLFLNNVSSQNGILLFGGVDSSKYSGQLYTVNMTTLNSVDFEILGQRLGGLLDSGTSYSSLPDDVISDLANQWGAQYNNNSQAYFSSRVPNDSVSFSFSGANISVPASEFFTKDGDNYRINISPSSSKQVVLGDTFLRSAYIVYDYDNNQISIAQADYNGSGTISAITSEGVPGAKPAPGF